MKYKNVKQYAQNIALLYNKLIQILEEEIHCAIKKEKPEIALERGLQMSKDGLTALGNPETLNEDLLERTPGMRPGISDSRYFGEIEGAFSNEENYDNLLALSHAIQRYYNAMGWEEYLEYAEKKLKENISNEEREELENNKVAAIMTHESIKRDYTQRFRDENLKMSLNRIENRLKENIANEEREELEKTKIRTIQSYERRKRALALIPAICLIDMIGGVS